MTSYTLEFGPKVAAELAAAWADAADRGAVTRADAAMNRLLTTDPVGASSRHTEGLYSLVVSPLIVVYEVDAVRRVVKVVGVGTTRPRGHEG